MKYVNLFFISLILLIGIVAAEPPKISLVVKPLEGIAPLTIAASEESGDLTIIDYQWDFGDGNRAFHEAKMDHVYEKPGEYNLILTVINEKGEETSDSVIIIVSEPEITPTPEPTEIPTRIVYEGATPIKDALTAKAKSSVTILKEETDKVMVKEKYPYQISQSEITIEKYRCDEQMQICGYWIHATRNGQEVATNSPVWISPPQYEVVVSAKYFSDLEGTIITTSDKAVSAEITIKEDPKAATESILQRYVDIQPLGKAIVGTKE